MVVSSGIPLTAGFLAKFYIVASGADFQAWSLILVLVITSAIGLFYYLRVITTLFHQPVSEGQAHESAPRHAPAVSLALAALTAFVVRFGVFPSPLLRLIQSAIGNIF